MLSTSALRPARALGTRIQQPQFIFASCTRAQFTTSSSSSLSIRPAKIHRTTAPQTCASIVNKPRIQFAFRTPARHASTAAPAQKTADASKQSTLTWNEFLALRRTRRRISLIASIVAAAGFTFVGLGTVMETNQEAALAAATGMDPFLILLGCTAVFMTAGWLIGPTFGNAGFNLRYRGLIREFERKERQFYERIKKHRVDPTSSSMANPVPDYYGEKIGSVAGYRRWLKDQRAFNLKRGAYHGQK